MLKLNQNFLLVPAPKKNKMKKYFLSLVSIKNPTAPQTDEIVLNQ
jgi:hypothetical protein